MRRSVMLGAIVMVVAIVLQPTTPARPTAAATWADGDLFAGVGGGQYQVRSPSGALIETLQQRVNGQPLGDNAAGCAFHNGKLYTTNWGTGDVVVFDAADPHGITQVIDTTTRVAATESVTFDQDGNILVGTIKGPIEPLNRPVLKYSPAGTFLDTYPVQTENSGSDWMDLSSDGKTLYYTSEGSHILRYDVATKTQLAPFPTPPNTGGYYAIRLLPPGDGTGGLIAAEQTAILRLDAQGNIVKTYSAPNELFWFSVNLDPDLTSFWAGDLGSGDIYRFDIETGDILTGPIDTGAGSFHLNGICVKGEPTTTASADLSITKTDSPDPVRVDNPLMYTLTAHNAGPDSASSVTITDALPAGVTFSSADSGCSNAAGTVTCSLGTMAAGTTITKHITVTPSQAAQALSNTASIDSPNADPASANDSSTITTKVDPAIADLSITKTDSPDPVKVGVGSGLTYTIAVHNSGPDPARSVTVTDMLPAGVTFSSASAGCSLTNGTVTCTLGKIASGGQVTKQIVVTPTQANPGLSNTASVTSSASDPVQQNNSATTTTVVDTKTADLSIIKTDLPDPVVTGHPLTYTLTVHNAGPDAASGVAVTDVLPAGVAFDSADADCSEQAGTVTCAIGAMPVGSDVTEHIVVTPDQPDPALQNSASVRSSLTPDEANGNNSSTATTSVDPGSADLAVGIQGGEHDSAPNEADPDRGREPRTRFRNGSRRDGARSGGCDVRLGHERRCVRRSERRRDLVVPNPGNRPSRALDGRARPRRPAAPRRCERHGQRHKPGSTPRQQLGRGLVHGVSTGHRLREQPGREPRHLGDVQGRTGGGPGDQRPRMRPRAGLGG